MTRHENDIVFSHCPYPEAEVASTCQGTTEMNLECAYDYRATANKEMAEATLKQTDWWKNVYEGVKPGKERSDRVI